jgi:hypothetical protein
MSRPSGSCIASRTTSIVTFFGPLFIYHATVSQVTAQPNLEEQLKLAKEKVAQIKPEHTISNTSVDLLSNMSLLNRLSNITLNQEQVKEVETIRDVILYPCVQRISSEKKDPGSLCDAFADYLADKCKRFDNLLDFCVGDTLVQYVLARNFQVTCLKSPPLFSDKKRIESCLTVLPLNSTYTDLPPRLSIASFYVYSSALNIRLISENHGYSPIMFENITYNIFQGGKKLDSGCIDHNSPCITSNSIGVLPNYTENYEIDADVDTTQDPSKQFIFNGTYYYHFPNSHALCRGFSYNATKEPCLITSLKC